MNRICRNIYPPGTNAQYFSASAALLRRLMEASKRLPLSHERALLGAFMAVLDIQITNSSLRDITGGIAATQDEGSWVSTSYLIGEIITIPLTAWLSRVFSVRWYLIANVACF